MTVYVKNGGIIISYKKKFINGHSIRRYSTGNANPVFSAHLCGSNRRSNQHRRGLDEQLLEKKSIDYLSRLKLYNT